MHEPAGVVEILVQILQNTPILKYSFRIPPPPENENCQRSWHFDFSVSEFPPPPRKIEIWADLGTLRLFSFRIPPPLPPKIEIKADLGTLRLFSFRTMCGKLPHVETLSSPDNYSFTRVMANNWFVITQPSSRDAKRPVHINIKYQTNIYHIKKNL